MKKVTIENVLITIPEEFRKNKTKDNGNIVAFQLRSV